MKILMITAAYPPIGGSHMQRVLNFSNSIQENGYDVTVISVDPSEGYPVIDNESAKRINKNIKVYYVQEGFLHKRTRKETNNIKNQTTKNGIKQKIYKILNNLKYKMLIPDTMIDWYFEAIKYIEEKQIIEKEKPDLILTSSMPNTCHLIGYRISKKYNIPLIMDYGDPWAFEQSIKRGKFRFKLEFWLENKIIKHAKQIIVATETTKQLYLNNYSIKSDKVQVAMMGFNEIELKSENVETNKNEKLLMSYAGALNPIHRNPKPLLEALSEIEDKEKIEILLRVNEINRIKEMVRQYNVSETVKVEGYIEYNKYLEEAKKCDALILFGNSSSLQISGKIFNYICTGVLILYIKNMQKEEYDPSEEILKDYGNYITVQNDADEIKRALQKIVEMKKIGNLKRNINLNVLKYSWKNQGLNVIKAINNVLIGKNGETEKIGRKNRKK